MENNSLKQYVFDSSDKKEIIKLEFHRNILNDIKIILKSKNTDMTSRGFTSEIQFDLEVARQISKKLNEYIRKQEKIREQENLKQIESVCKHENTESTHPYGWLACSDCHKLLS